MDELTLLDLTCMLLNTRIQGHRANMEILKSLYEREHTFFIARFSGFLILAGSIVAAVLNLMSSQPQGQNVNGSVLTISIIALLVAVAMVIRDIYLLGRLKRQYLNIVKIYNLLSRYY